jgi:hypothetical protein
MVLPSEEKAGLRSQAGFAAAAEAGAARGHAASEPRIGQRQIGRTGDHQPDRQGELHTVAECVGGRSHGGTIRRFDAWSPRDSFSRDSPLINDSGPPASAAENVRISACQSARDAHDRARRRPVET